MPRNTSIPIQYQTKMKNMKGKDLSKPSNERVKPKRTKNPPQMSLCNSSLVVKVTTKIKIKQTSLAG